MKVWQNPGGAEKAQWKCLSSDDWEVEGGHWYKPVPSEGPRVFYVVFVHATTDWGDDFQHPFWGQVRRLDLALLTLPERKDAGYLGADDIELLEACLHQGWGLPLGSDAGKTAKHVRSQVKKLADRCIEDAGELTRVSTDEAEKRPPAMHYMRWARLRKAEPLTYMAGFILGMRRADVEDSVAPAYEAGWRHGWEYAVGRVPLPEWFTQRSSGEETG